MSIAEWMAGPSGPGELPSGGWRHQPGERLPSLPAALIEPTLRLPADDPHLLDDLGRSLDRLAEALQVPEAQPLAIDGTIQRFECTFELYWKTPRRFLASQGIEANSPEAVLQQAYRLARLADEEAWLQLLKDRNLSSHAYRESLALEIYQRVPAHAAAIREVFGRLRNQSPAE